MFIIGLLVALIYAVMSYRPGVSVSTSVTPTPHSAPTGTGIAFISGITEAGPTTPQYLRSMVDYARIFGSRQSYSATIYDWLDTYFHEGGAEVWVARAVGPAAVTASKNLLDGVAAISLIASAKGPGAGTIATVGNQLKVAVLAGVVSGYRIQVLDANNNVLETSNDLTTQQDAENWAVNSQYINIAIGASANPPVVAAAASLAGGNDDRVNVVDATYTTALGLFTKDYGPGQVAIPGRTTDSAHAIIAAHAALMNRVALYDLPDTPTPATLQTSGQNARVNERGASFAPWVQVPGVVVGTTRTVPPSAFIAALCARNDGQYGPDQPYAGDLGQAQWITGLSQPAWDDPTRQNLNNASVNVIRSMFGGFRNYGWRSSVDPIAAPQWIDFGNVRLAMAIQAEAEVIGEMFLFQQLDGAGTTIGHFNAALVAMLQKYYARGALYGATPDAAFYVDTGPTINTLQTIQNNELHAILNVKMSPMAEWVQITVAKVPITQGVI